MIAEGVRPRSWSVAVNNVFGEIYWSWKINRRGLTEPAQKMTQPTLSIGMKLFLSLSFVPVFKRIAIRKMRNYAWNTAQIRKNLRPLS